MGSCAYLPATFKRKVTVQAVTRVADGQGGFAESWSDVGTAWCSVEPVKAYEKFQAMQMATPVTHKLVMRYSPLVTATSRLTLGTRVFAVTEVIDRNDDRRYLTVKAVETLVAAADTDAGSLALRGGGHILLRDGGRILLRA